MFKHAHHRKILRILESLDSSIFRETSACFGGGTLISLLFGEYRWSKDVDFICPVGPTYRRLREFISNGNFRPEIFFARHDLLQFPRELKADQYGVRFLIIVDDTPIKFEIISEARIPLAQPEYPAWSPIPCLNPIDRYAEKLLSNADRWADSSVESRDLIDLAVLRLNGEQSNVAIEKAETAYPVIDPLKKAVAHFQGSSAYRKKCFDALQIDRRAYIMDGIELLAGDIGLRG